MDYPANSYCAQVSQSGWQLPTTCNIGIMACDEWAEKTPDAPAIILAEESRTASYSELRTLSNKTANLLQQVGLKRGERIGVLLPQMLETATVHLAAFKLGAVSVPLFMLFGPDALQHRVLDAGIKIIITNTDGAVKLSNMDADAREAVDVYTVDDAPDDLGTLDFATLLEDQSTDFEPVQTSPDDPAIIIYTSGTTGSPKGALHGHRVLLGHMPGFETFNDFQIKPGNVIWTPADWAWIGGMFDVLFPALASGMTVLAKRFDKFTAEAAFELMSNYNVQHAFLPPTALKLMRASFSTKAPQKLNLIAVGSGGETLGVELLDWGKVVLGVTINEFYGQTEANLIVSSCAALWPSRPGIMGRVTAGHKVSIIDESGAPVPQGVIGLLAVKAPDPVIMLRYWNNEEATREKYINEWLVTGDMGIVEDHGWLRFVGRDDDVITSAGYRIGPGSIEDCLMRHPAVQMAGVVGKRDEKRTEIVKAFIVLAPNLQSSDDLILDLQTHVKTRLAAHEYPREIAIVDDLPTTATGKIMRGELRKLG